MGSKHCWNCTLRRLHENRRRPWAVKVLFGFIKNYRSDIWYFPLHCWCSRRDNWKENSQILARVSNFDVLPSAWNPEAKQKVILGREWTGVSVVQVEGDDLREWVSFDASWNELKLSRSRAKNSSQQSATMKSTRERSVESVQGPSQLRNHVDESLNEPGKGKWLITQLFQQVLYLRHDDGE